MRIVLFVVAGAVNRAKEWGLLMSISFWKGIVFLAPAAALQRDRDVYLISEISLCDCHVSWKGQ